MRSNTRLIIVGLLLLIPLLLLLKSGGNDSAKEPAAPTPDRVKRIDPPRKRRPAKNRPTTNRRPTQPGRVHSGTTETRVAASEADLIASLNQAQGAHRNGIIENLARHYGSADLKQATKTFNRLSENDKVAFARQVVAGLVVDDPQAALDWINSLGGRNRVRPLYTAFAQEWAVVDIDAALKWAEALTYNNHRVNAMEGISRTWAAADHEAAAEWAASLPGPDQRKVLRAIVKKWIDDDIDGTYHWVMALPDSAARKAGLVELGRSWAHIDPVAAGNWAATFPPGQNRTNTLINVAAVFRDTDPKGAAEWFNSLSADDKSTRTAFSGTSSAWAMKEPEQAANWVTTVHDESLQDAGFDMVFRQWARRNYNEGMRWLETAEISEERKEALIKTMDQYREY